MPLLLFLLLAKPFWEAKPPAEWSNEELERMFYNSPWGQEARVSGPAPAVVVYLATAKPMRDAEAETTRRFLPPGAKMDPTHDDYEDWLRENPGKLIVLAVRVNPKDGLDAADVQRMDQESFLKAGKKKWKLLGHFPPTPRDPWLRLVFPREVTAKDKSVEFGIYVPGLSSPYRQVAFALKDLLFNGSPEF